MRKFTKFTLFLAMLIAMSSNAFAADVYTYYDPDCYQVKVGEYLTTNSGYHVTNFGLYNVCENDFSSAFGYGNFIQSYNSVALGFFNNASPVFDESGTPNYSEMDYGECGSGYFSTAVGILNKTSSSYSRALGYNNYAYGDNSSAVGYQNKAINFGSSAFGYESMANAANSTALGYQAVAGEAGTVSFGHSSTDTNFSGVAYGSDLEAKLVHVASGTALTDAVNYGQVKDAFVNASFDSTTRKLTLTNVNGSTVDVEIPGGSGSGSDPELESKVTQNTTDIATNKTAIAQNTTDIATNKTNIAKNSSEIENIKKTQEGLGIASSKKNDNTFSDGSIAIGSKNESGKEAKVSMAIGSDNVVVGKNSIAIGYAIKGKNNDFIGNTVNGDYSIAVGFGHTIIGNNSGAFGDPSYIASDSAYAVGNNNHIVGDESFIVGNNSDINGKSSFAFGNKSKITAENAIAFGNNTEVSGKNAIAIGEGAKATAENSVAIGQGSEAKDSNTVSVGSETNKRRITNVADAQEDNDAVNYGQMKDYVAANGGNSGEVIKLRNDLNKMDGRVSKVGASAGALAALKPMEFDPDNKWSAGVGFGNLNGKNAAAVGLFYRPNRDVYYSLGGNVGGEENIVNAGINFSFGHRSEKPVEARHYTVLHDNAVGVSNVNTVDAAEFDVFCQENAELKDKVAAQDAEIISQKNEISDLKYRIKHLERLMLKMSKK